eukprot:12885316-Prorocentrum_lima.AAC.1
MSVEEQQARDEGKKLCQRMFDEELKKRDQHHQALMKQRVDTLQQQLSQEKEAAEKGKDRADRLQVQRLDFSPG